MVLNGVVLQTELECCVYSVKSDLKLFEIMGEYFRIILEFGILRLFLQKTSLKVLNRADYI